MPVRVRPLQPPDVDEGIDVFGAVAAEGLWLGSEAGFDRPARRALWLADIGDAQTRSLVVERVGDARIVGYGRVHRHTYGVADLGMALLAEVRGRGIGGLLLDRLVTEAESLGAHKVELQVWPHNEPALRLYLSRGFVVEGRVRSHYPRVTGQLWDAVLMGLPLPRSRGRTGSGLPDASCLPHELAVGEARSADGT